MKHADLRYHLSTESIHSVKDVKKWQHLLHLPLPCSNLPVRCFLLVWNRNARSLCTERCCARQNYIPDYSCGLDHGIFTDGIYEKSIRVNHQQKTLSSKKAHEFSMAVLLSFTWTFQNQQTKHHHSKMELKSIPVPVGSQKM